MKRNFSHTSPANRIKIKRIDPVGYKRHLIKRRKDSHAYFAELKRKNPKQHEQYLAKHRRWVAKNKIKVRQIQFAWAARKPWMKLLVSTRAAAKARGLKFSITHKWLENQFKTQKFCCKITKIKFQPIKNRNPFQPSVDRINNSIGYIESNCQLVCLIYNYSKSVFSHKDVVRFAKSLLCSK